MRLLRGHHGSVRAVATSPDGRLIATGGADRRVCVFDIGSGRLLREFQGHTNEVTAVAFSQVRGPRLARALARS